MERSLVGIYGKSQNPDVNEMTTTFIILFTTQNQPVEAYPSIDKLLGVSASEWANVQKEAMGHYLKNYRNCSRLKVDMGHKQQVNPPILPY